MPCDEPGVSRCAREHSREDHVSHQAEHATEKRPECNNTGTAGDFFSFLVSLGGAHEATIQLFESSTQVPSRTLAKPHVGTEGPIDDAQNVLSIVALDSNSVVSARREHLTSNISR